MATASSASGISVFKFGGTSVGDLDAVRRSIDHVLTKAPRVGVVVSAMSGVTDALLDGIRDAAKGETAKAQTVATEFAKRHTDIISSLVRDADRAKPLLEFVHASALEYLAVAQSVSVLREATPHTYDAAVSRGERVLARIFNAALKERGTRSQFVDATEVVFTAHRFGSLWPDWERCEAAARETVLPHLERGAVVVMPGFIGTGPDGELITLGRGGSDFSAALLGRIIGATEVVLYKEVDGVLTADPKRVPDAALVPELHYREAAELAYYGAKVLHPRTMIPLAERGIPLWLRNTFRPSQGTRVASDVVPGGYPVRALSSVVAQSLVSVEGKGMLGVPGVAARTFTAVSKAGISVSMISQGSSEASICFVVPDVEAEAARHALQDAFREELDAGLLERVRIDSGLALVSIVGLGMRGTRGVAGRTFMALSRDQVNVVAISQGSSELSITVAIEAGDVTNALKALHREFQLNKRAPLADPMGREAAVAVLGLGQIGRAFTRQLIAQKKFFDEQMSLDLRCIALADQSGVRVAKDRFSSQELEGIVQQKAKGVALTEREVSPGNSQRVVLEDLRTGLWPVALYRPVLVDLTATDTTALLMEALENHFHLVLANKRPLSGPQADFDRLFALAQQKGRFIRYEATVGAGLPVIDTVRKLLESGDEIVSVQGCFSGTLGYLMTQLEAGVAFSAAVLQAKRLGYTEPDPKDDLSGMDVARKVLILARTLGRKAELSDVRVEALFPESMRGMAPEEFLSKLPTLDAEYAAKLEAARADGKVLRYVATADAQGLRVGLEALALESPIGRLNGTDNQIVLHTRRYAHNPLVVTGPGAGAEVTASGVLNDVLAIAAGDELRPVPATPTPLKPVGIKSIDTGKSSAAAPGTGR